MRRDYLASCAEDETEARSRLSGESREQREQQRTARQLQAEDQEQVRLRAQQCAESRRILVTKRNRTDLTEGERAELARFEGNYKARCER